MKQSLTADEINSGYESLISALKSVDPKVLLEIANSIWYTENFTVLPDFINVNQQYYDAEVSSLNFSDPVASTIINGWVDEKTHGKIEKVIESIGGDVVMILINAIYFKGIWRYGFDKAYTRPGPFYTDDGHSSTVDFMSQETTIPVMYNDTFAMADIPYGRGNFSMTILLPNQGYSTDDVLGALNSGNWNHWVSQLTEHKVNLVMPRFKFEYDNLLNEELTDMGMGVAFSGMADFSGINGVGGIRISKVIHKSFVEVNEEGTEAAAVTVVEIEFTSGNGSSYPFVVNRPFIFAIRETTTGAVLFIGKAGRVGSGE